MCAAVHGPFNKGIMQESTSEHAVIPVSLAEGQRATRTRISAHQEVMFGGKKIKGWRRKRSSMLPFPREGAGETKVVGNMEYIVMPNGEWRRNKTRTSLLGNP